MHSRSNRNNNDFVLNDSELDEEESPFTSSNSNGLTWIEWFCRHKENRFFVEIEEDYIRDDFNLTGLSQLVPHYHKALDVVLDSEEDASDASGSITEKMYDTEAAILFGLIHARYILTIPGIQAMFEKFKLKTYGICPNTKCREQPVLPVGLSDMPKNHKTVVYCPRCREIYYPVNPRLRNLDGAYFGTSFAPLFFMQHQHLSNSENFPEFYIPRICGFRVSPECRTLGIDEERKAAA